MIKITEIKPKKMPGKTSLAVEFNYKPELVSIVKTCTPCYYDKKSNSWEIPTTRLSKLINLLSEHDDIELNLLSSSKATKPPKEIILSKYKTNLFHHQEDGIKYGLSHDKWLLLDMPGLGKTLQMTYLAQELKNRDNIKHCLIVCGVNALKTNWKKEIAKHSDLTCTILGERVNTKGKVVYGGVKDRINQLMKPIKEFFVITNVETLRSKEFMKALSKSPNKFDMIVVDEIHKCKSPTSSQTMSLLKLKAKYQIGLTGTPLMNNPLDLYVPLKWLDKDKATYTNFKGQYCSFGGPFHNEIIGYKNLDVLKSQLEECSLRRTKDLLNLPPKTIIYEEIELDDSQRNFYDNIVNGVLDEIDKVHISNASLLALVARLRQATACPSILTTENIPSAKINRCVDLIEEICSNDSKVVVFSTFKDTLKEIEKLIPHYNPLVCTGDIDSETISANEHLFQTNPDNKVILCTHQKMGTGFTLTAASYAIFIDSPWTNADCQQAEDRIHRISAKDPVFIYYLIAKDTFDERVKEIVTDKSLLEDFVVDNKLTETGYARLSSMVEGLRK